MSAVARFVASTSRTSSRDLAGPMELDVKVTISNPTRETRDIWISGCSAWIRIYSTPADTGRPLVDVPRSAQCEAAPRHLVLAPGESQILPAEGFRLTISADTLPNERVYVFGAVDRIRDLVNVPAGPVDVTSPNAGLAFAVSTAVTGARNDTLRAHVTITDTTSQPWRLEYGACALALFAYRTPTRTGPPAWNSTQRRTAGGLDYMCPLYLRVGILEAGETSSPRELNAAYPLTEILGDSLPNGRYYFTAHVRMNWRTKELPAGDAELRR